MSNFLKTSIMAVLLLVLAQEGRLFAQVGGETGFRSEAFSQNYNPTDTLERDTTAVLFSFRDYFRGVRHVDKVGPGTLFAGSMIFLGGQQIYNDQTWKLPMVYGGIGAGLGLGIYYNHRYHQTGNSADKNRRSLAFAGAGLAYWLMLMDGNASYKVMDDDIPTRASKATMYSLLLPGLGQVYNGEYWKIPLYYTGLLFTASYVHHWNMNYRRYRRIYNEITVEDSQYTGNISASTALYFRNVSRRYRDYFIVGFVAMYLLQVIDANVFAFMQNFEVDDNITMKLGPALLPADNVFALGGSPRLGNTAIGMRLGITF